MQQVLLWSLFHWLLQADWFKQYQQSATEQVKGQLWSHWLPKCVDVFRRLPPVPINGDTEAYFRYLAQLYDHQQLAHPAHHTLPCQALIAPNVVAAAGVSVCRAVATLQSNQLRGLVSASLSDYLAFFKQHKAVQQLDPQQDSCMWSCRPVFETELVAVQGELLEVASCAQGAGHTGIPVQQRRCSVRYQRHSTRACACPCAATCKCPVTQRCWL
jgi:hypothetical protein